MGNSIHIMGPKLMDTKWKIFISKISKCKGNTIKEFNKDFKII